VTTAISSAIQAAVISHASPMPVRTAHAARIVVSLRLGPPCKVSFDDENCAYGQS
jgi:hypothetical protein